MKTIVNVSSGLSGPPKPEQAERPTPGPRKTRARPLRSEVSATRAVEKMSQSARFWDRTAERYSKSPIADEAAYQRKLQVSREYFRPDMAVLEFGCGTGATAILHAPYVKHIRAIDFSTKMIEIAQGKAEAQKVENVTFEHSTIEGLCAADQSFDAVLGLNVLHLLENKEEAIAKVYRMLKPNGVFITSTVCLGDSAMKVFKVISPIGKFFGLMPTVRVFATKALERSLTDAGFDIDYQWRPGSGKSVFKSVFVVAKKAGAIRLT